MWWHGPKQNQKKKERKKKEMTTPHNNLIQKLKAEETETVGKKKNLL